MAPVSTSTVSLYETLFATIRGTGFVTRDQSHTLVDLVLANLSAEACDAALLRLLQDVLHVLEWAAEDYQDNADLMYAAQLQLPALRTAIAKATEAAA